MITYKQLTLAEIFEDCQNKFDNYKYQFLSLLDEAINLDEIVPCCPHGPSLPMKRDGSKSHLKSKIPTMKFVIP